MRVLVTRAEKAGQKTAARLLALGHQPILLPLAKPVHTPQNAIAALSQPHSGLIITSGEAVRALEAIKVQLAPHFSTPLFVVGSTTEKAARRLGFHTLQTADGDGAALARLIGQNAQKSDDPLLYLAGKPRAKTLEHELQAQDLPLTTAEIYRMETIVYQPQDIVHALDNTPVDAVLLYSAETTRRFCALPMPDRVATLLASAHCLCLSEQVAGPLIAPFNTHVAIAEHPDEESLLALLENPS